MRRIALLMLPLLVLAGPLSAGPLDKSQIPADAKWVLHADLEGFLASKVGTAVLEEARKRGLDMALGAVQAMFGFDPTKDIKDVAVYGTDFKEPVVLLHAKLDRAKVLAIVKANPGFGEANYGEHVIYLWREKAKGDEDAGEGAPAKAGPKRFGCFWGEDVALIAQDAAALKHAIDVLDKKADSLAKDGVAGPLPALVKGAWLVGGLTDVATLVKEKAAPKEEDGDKPMDAAAMIFLRKFSAASVQLGEADDKVFLNLSVTAADARVATDLRKIVDGVLALVDLAADVKSEDKPGIPAELTDALKNVKVSGEGRVVNVDVALPVQDVLAGLRKLIEQDKAKKAQGESSTGAVKVEFKVSD